MPNFTKLPTPLSTSINFTFKIDGTEIVPWYISCNKKITEVKHESGSFEHQTIDGPELDHCGIDKFTLKCHNKVEQFAVHIFQNPIQRDRIG